MKNIFFYILTGLSLIGFIFIVGGLGRRYHEGTIYITMIGFVLLTPTTLYLLFLFIKHRRDNKNAIEKLISFKDNSIKIKVKVGYKIITNDWTEEVEIGTHRTVFWNEITGNSLNNVRLEKRYANTIVISICHNSKIEKAFYSSSKDPETLKMLLEINKETILYINKEDSNLKYLDLEFLD